MSSPVGEIATALGLRTPASPLPGPSVQQPREAAAGNCGALCVECHQRKTAGLLDITDSRADGSASFHTAYGQAVRIPARPYLPRTPGHLSTPLEPPPF